jgi:ABC-2 type transport system ATP-binding protein
LQHFAVQVDAVSKQFGTLRALDAISLEIVQGEIFGLIGPNGAGKTTLVNLITGMLAPDRGTMRTVGLDPVRQERELRERIGVQFQEAELPHLMTAKEALELYSSFYTAPRPWRPLAEEWNLAAKLGTRFDKLSGGQKQRLFICLALLNKPQLVVLDELTTGLDPHARRQSWDLVRRIRDAGTTVLLVTHFMDEAEALCDRIALIDQGQIVAEGTPAELSRGIGEERIAAFTAPPGFDPASLGHLGDVRAEGSTVTVAGKGFVLASVAGELARQGVNPPDLRTQRNSLEDVFLRLTNHNQQEPAA